MKLLRFGPFRQEKPGVALADGTRRDCSSLVRDYDAEFFRSGGLAQLAALVGERGATLPLVPEGERWGAPVARPGKVIRRSGE